MVGRAHQIVVVLHDLPLGGTERIALRLGRRWGELGRKVTLFCGSRAGALSGQLSDRLEIVERSPPLPRGPRSRHALGASAAEFVASVRPDLVFIPGNYHWPVVPYIAALRAHVRPTVVAQASTPLFRHGRSELRQIAYNLRTRRQLRHADATVALSPSMAADVDRVLGRRTAQWLPLPALDDADGQTLSQAQGDTILAAGRLVPEKGFDVAIRAFADLNVPQARLVIVGEGPQRAALQELAARLGVADRVSLPGFVPDIGPWLEACRVFLLSSYYEGYAAVVIEALAKGRPVVATRCTPACAELIAVGGAGAVAPIGDVRRLTASLRTVMGSPPPDPYRLSRLVEGFRIGPIAENYLRIFDEVHARRADLQLSAWPWRTAASGALHPTPA